MPEKSAFNKYLKELDFETIKLLHRDHKAREKMKEIDIRLSMTRIDEQKMKNIEERKNIDDIPTRIEMIRSEHSSTSDSSSSSDSEHKRKKSKKKKNCHKHRKDDS